MVSEIEFTIYIAVIAIILVSIILLIVNDYDKKYNHLYDLYNISIENNRKIRDILYERIKVLQSVINRDCEIKLVYKVKEKDGDSVSYNIPNSIDPKEWIRLYSITTEEGSDYDVYMHFTKYSPGNIEEICPKPGEPVNKTLLNIDDYLEDNIYQISIDPNTNKKLISLVGYIHKSDGTETYEWNDSKTEPTEILKFFEELKDYVSHDLTNDEDYSEALEDFLMDVKEYPSDLSQDECMEEFNNLNPKVLRLGQVRENTPCGYYIDKYHQCLKIN